MKKLILVLLISQISWAHQELFDALNSENISRVEKLIKNKKHLSVKDANGHDVLYHAVSLNEIPLIKKVILAGAKTDQTYNETKESILFEATRLGSKEVVELLLSKNPKLLDKKNSKNESVLVEAVKAKQDHLAELYKNKGLTK